MTILYNCRHAGDQYRITKFNPEMNVESSYLCTLEECDCPRGPHPTCRHRQMLPKFIARQHVGDEWFLDIDRGGWVQMDPRIILIEDIDLFGPSTTYYEKPNESMPPLPEGVTMISLENPVAVHNAIAEAVGEPGWGEIKAEDIGKPVRINLPPDASPTHIKRRF